MRHSAAVKLARAYTGRDLIAICADHPFFSTDDWFIGTTADERRHPGADQGADGRLQLQRSRHRCRRCSTSIRAGSPRSSWSRRAPTSRTTASCTSCRRLCHAHGALFILDEMITGFRWHSGGAQKPYDIGPDLSTFGKALANGFSVSALAGQREFMRLGGLDHVDRPRVFLLSTTHGAETHALAAAIATMRIYQNEPVIEHLTRQGERLREQAEAVIRHHRLEDYVSIIGRASCLLYGTRDRRRQRLRRRMRTLLLQETIRRGVLMPSLVVSYSHTDEDIERTIEAFDGALGVYRQALDGGVERFLVGRPSEPVMRNYNTTARQSSLPVGSRVRRRTPAAVSTSNGAVLGARADG